MHPADITRQGQSLDGSNSDLLSSYSSRPFADFLSYSQGALVTVLGTSGIRIKLILVYYVAAKRRKEND